MPYDTRFAGSQIERLLRYALANGLIEEIDVPYSRNRLLDLLGLDAPGPIETPCDPLPDTATPMLEALLDYAAESGLLADNTPGYRAMLDGRLMDAVLARPSEVCARFDALREEQSVAAATSWFYNLCRKSNYIRVDDIARNLIWDAQTRYGTLTITINLSRPEKDPREIAALAKKKPGGRTKYPSCLLCLENVGYAGRLDHPARQTLRVLPVELCGQQWYFQYSPYVYYNQHCIVLKAEHEPMRANSFVLNRLLHFLDQFDHYFIGSNAGLPVVGGSILDHDHFQGGMHEFPMNRAACLHLLRSTRYPDVSCEMLNWPLSTLRLKSADRKQLLEAGAHVFNRWLACDAPECGVFARTEQGLHNAITPIVRKHEGEYEMYLGLRNNRTTDEHPDGVFHPHAYLHHIKRENIGLIEAMGLFILPGRLEAELAYVQDVLCGRMALKEAMAVDAAHPLHKHLDWLEGLAAAHGYAMTEEAARALIREEVGRICALVLEDTGVFKMDETGIAAFLAFASACGFERI